MKPENEASIPDHGDESRLRAATTHHCGMCGRDYPVGGSHSCSNYAAPESTTIGALPASAAFGTTNERTQLVHMSMYRQMMAERDDLQSAYNALAATYKAKLAECAMLEAERDRAAGVIEVLEAWQEPALAHIAELMARSERTARQRDHARAMATYYRRLYDHPGAAVRYPPFYHPDAIVEYPPFLAPEDDDGWTAEGDGT